MSNKELYEEIGERARARRENSIPKHYLLPDEVLARLPKNVTSIARTSKHFTYDEIEIIESQAEDILLKIRERIWTSLEVTGAFCKAAAVAQQLVRRQSIAA